MTWPSFIIILACCSLTILICRVIPLFILKGKEIPQGVIDGLGFIPPAAFAALVANDLFTPGMFDAGLWPAATPLIAAALVVAVAYKTRSLIWSIVTGVLSYGLLTLI